MPSLSLVTRSSLPSIQLRTMAPLSPWISRMLFPSASNTVRFPSLVRYSHAPSQLRSTAVVPLPWQVPSFFFTKVCSSPVSYTHLDFYDVLLFACPTISHTPYIYYFMIFHKNFNKKCLLFDKTDILMNFDNFRSNSRLDSFSASYKH